ncbi:putative acetyltransferase [Crocosphaera subtropica ATCC 51142]|uniref:Acetyltransferase n=1 Tax=Crocosphaera subtropica (strain ATCC 51142 / BH68) TaxID=43989 RepID=B1WQ55_CROS5|nr:GNAT family N-acetyltransferase [Crocosphaera subtropica]ACB49977.1 putative acetyltransferase [Crocosphaera subtropica ATCC 51142]
MIKILTPRLKLREWKEEDKEPFFKLNSDPRVMEFMPKLLSKEESDNFVERIKTHFQTYQYGLFAVELIENQNFIGFIGLSIPKFDAFFTPCVEIGWRLAYDYWGKGYASEGAKASLNYGFQELSLSEIVSFTFHDNVRSRQVMERIGMKYMGEFNHPALPKGHPLEKHVLYKIMNK